MGSRDRESLFNEFQSEIRKKERDEKEERRKVAKKDFKSLMKETESIDRHSHWADIKKTIDKDERYLAVDSSSLREDWSCGQQLPQRGLVLRLRPGSEGRAQEGEGEEER